MNNIDYLTYNNKAVSSINPPGIKRKEGKNGLDT